MKPLDQRYNECSLCSICTLNSLSQKDYEAVSDLAKEAGADYRKLTGPAITIGAKIAQSLGLTLPEGYPNFRTYFDTSDPAPDFTGRGIVRVAYIPKRCRNYRSHVVAFENGVLYNSNGFAYSWASYLKFLKKELGARQIRIPDIFRA